MNFLLVDNCLLLKYAWSKCRRQSNGGKTGLELAKENGNISVAELLKQKGPLNIFLKEGKFGTRIKAVLPLIRKDGF
ncbi:hypothetical protein RCG23_09475 [Neobacillus sp. PS3-34]|uniref:hypothetical protein n=1 Tax=Neobacillus sp. PS3-34 TaxID=3070678 RepID=UPI0027E105E5|nr:hypothetical protein [Neobacillus sp. PS3-34]WML50047.1 hypothetical protein RCG23_09475 [Neobacillus sp. PS3-34]